ncbi:hypothetical protein Tco_1433582 [Tanacetum coccineum]
MSRSVVSWRGVELCDTAIVEREAEIAHLKNLVEEKPSKELARLRLRKEEVDKMVDKQVEELRKKADKMLGFFSHLLEQDTELSTINGIYEDLFKLRLSLNIVTPVSEIRLTGKLRWIGSIKKSLLRSMRDVVETKKWVVSKGFRYLLEKFKESDLLGAYLGVWISTVITDGMRQGLKVGIVHGRKGTDINSIPAYDPNAAEAYANALNALNNVPFLLFDNLEACACEKLSYFQALLVMTFESDVNVLTGTVSESVASAATASVPPAAQDQNPFL